MAAPDIRFVELTAETAAALTDGADALFDNPLRPDSLKAFLDDPNHLLWFAAAAGQPVGFASASLLLHSDKAPQLFINEVDVLERFRRKGVGRALVARLVEAARARGCDCAWLGIDTDNTGGNACFASGPGAQNAGPFMLNEWELDQPDA